MSERATVRRDLVVFFVLALVVRGIGAALVPFPPHVDAAYYTMVAEQLAMGGGFTAPALWSFLEVGGRLPADAVLPVPSNAHWMPLPGLVAAGPMALLGADWRAGQVAMVLLSAVLVPMTYLAGWLIWRSRRVAVAGATLALAGGSLLLMYPLVESFAVFGVLGGAALLVSVHAVSVPRPGPWLVLAGALAGLASLTRIDGVLLTVAPAIAWAVRRPWDPAASFGGPIRALAWGAASAAAFLLVVSPWLLRNLDLFGTPLPSPGDRMLWIRDYNEHLSIGLDLTLERYLDWGLPAIAWSKAVAALAVIGRALGVFGGIFALSFVAGLWTARRDPRLAPFIGYVVVMLTTMVVLFTEHAPKGAFLHTAPAWLPIALPMSVAGIAPMANAFGRAWPFLRRTRTHRFLEVVGLVGAVVLSVAGAAALLGQWEVRTERLRVAAAYLDAVAGPNDVLLAGDPSSLHLLTGLHGVATPFDPYEVLSDVVDAYSVDWVVVALEPGTSVDPLGLWNGADAVDATGATPTFLPAEPTFEADGVRVFRVVR